MYHANADMSRYGAQTATLSLDHGHIFRPLAIIACGLGQVMQSSDETPMMRSGNEYLRCYLVEAANSLRMHSEEYAAYYQTKYREATTHHHKRACVLTARKLVRLVHTLLRKNQLYQTHDQRKEAPAVLPAGMTPGELARHVVRRRQAKGRFRVHLDH